MAAINKLTLTVVKNAKAKDKQYKMTDGNGLYLLVSTKGKKYWRKNYSFRGKQKTLSLGIYPAVTLLSARQKNLEAAQLLMDNIDPSFQKQKVKAQSKVNTFRAVAAEWFEKVNVRWNDKTAKKLWRTLENYAFPTIGEMSIDKITTRDIIDTVLLVEKKGALDTANRVKQRIKLIFRHAYQFKYIEVDVAASIYDIVKEYKPVHRKSLDLNLLPEFLFYLDKYDANIFAKNALKIVVHCFLRADEVVSAEWCDIDLKNLKWVVPAHKMKGKYSSEHVVPLTQVTVSIFEEMKKYSAGHRYVFPAGGGDKDGYMSIETMRKLIQFRLNNNNRGYGYDATTHGFRTVASTILNEHRFDSTVIEKQLSHVESNKVKAAYDRSQLIDERTELMSWYSDHLLSLKAKFEDDYLNDNQ